MRASVCLLYVFFLLPLRRALIYAHRMTWWLIWLQGKSGWQNVFISLPPLAYRRRALVLGQTYGPMLAPGLVQKGLEPAGWSVSVCAAAPCCISKPLVKQQIVLRRPHMSSHTNTIMYTAVTSKPTCWVFRNDLSLSCVASKSFNHVDVFCTVCKMSKSQWYIIVSLIFCLFNRRTPVSPSCCIAPVGLFVSMIQLN